MVNERVKKILGDCSKESLEEVSQGFVHKRDVDYDYFAKQIVGETILAIMAADIRASIYTTYDKQLADGVIHRVLDSVKKHWDFK
jgi:hypothetical protein